MNIHEKYIKRCIELSKNGLGTSYPNPLVGSVIVHKDTIIGEGWHLKAGKPHAEVNAINSVKNKKLLKKATLYVSLEPCSHFGKTPPCSDLIIEKGIKNVVIGTIDPFARVAGKGVKKLLEANCKLIVGVLEDECRYVNRRFFTFHIKKRPYIILKWAESEDGFLSPQPYESSMQKGEPIWITNKISRQLVHKWRSEEQAILVGTRTALLDNPSLTTRDWHGTSALRLALDRKLKIPKNASLFSKEGETLIFTDHKIPSRSYGHITYENVPFNDSLLNSLLSKLYNSNIQSLIVEGGAQTLNEFIKKGLWDEARVFVGPKVFKQGIPAPNITGNLIEKEKNNQRPALLMAQQLKNIIFDFGDIFIDLDKPATLKQIKNLGLSELSPEMQTMNQSYEKGLVSTSDFVNYYHHQLPNTKKDSLIEAWNAIILDFPEYRLQFIEKLAQNNRYKLFLLSNTNELHITEVKKRMTTARFERFKVCFQKFYLSHEINLRKPDHEIFHFVLDQNNLVAEQTLFIDDTPENTDAARIMGLKVWNLVPGKEDIIQLTKKYAL